MQINHLYKIRENTYRCTVQLDHEPGLVGLHYVWFETDNSVVMPMCIEGEGWDDYIVPDFSPEIAYAVQVAVQSYVDQGVAIEMAADQDRDEELKTLDLFMGAIIAELSLGVTLGYIELGEMKWHQITLPSQ